MHDTTGISKEQEKLEREQRLLNAIEQFYEKHAKRPNVDRANRYRFRRRRPAPSQPVKQVIDRVMPWEQDDAAEVSR